ALIVQVIDVRLGAAENDVGEYIRHASVDLLGIEPIHGPNSPFYMSKRAAQLAFGNRRGQRGVDVPITQRAVGLLGAKNRGKLKNGLRGKIHAIGVGNVKVIIRSRKLKAFKEGLRHLVVMVLAGVNQNLPNSSAPA